MTTKERNLAYILGGVLVLVLAGVVGYWFILSPYQVASEAVAKRHGENLDLDDKAAKIKYDKMLFEMARQQSLPADTKMSRGQYATFLETLGRKADISPAAMKVVSGDPDTKSGVIPGTKKSAYTKLGYTVTLTGVDLYRVTDLLRHFYEQPLLHTVKSINVQKPSDARAQGSRLLDVTLAIEALVLEGAPDRPSLLPVTPALGLMSGAAIQTVYNWTAVTSGSGAPVPVRGVLADQKREYLTIAGKNPFYGPPKKDFVEQESRPDDDSTPFLKLVSLVYDPDGATIVAKFWDPLTNNNYTATQQVATGAISVIGEYLVRGKRLTIPGYTSSKERASRDLFYGTTEGKNKRAWRVRRLTETEVILEKLDLSEVEAKPKATPAALAGGGPGVFVAVPEKKVYRLTIGQTLAEPSMLEPREAWRTIYAKAKLPVSAAPTMPTAEEGPPPAEVVGANREE